MNKEYYKNRKREMERLRFEEKASTSQIGKKFGVSRERVRQIIGNTSHLVGYYSRYSNTLRDLEWMDQRSDKTNKEIADEVGCSVRYVKRFRLDEEYPHEPNSICGKVKDRILHVRNILSNLDGLDVVVMPWHSPYCLLVNGSIKVSVRVGASSWNPPSQKEHLKSPMYRFRIYNKQHVDFYVFIIDDKEKGSYAEFVVPVEDITYSGEVTLFCYPTLYPGRSRYLKYKDRWDLIGN